VFIILQGNAATDLRGGSSL